MQYLIRKAEEATTKTGKAFKKAVVDGVGDVSVWPDYSHYAEVLPGAMVEGVIREKDKYKNLVDDRGPNTPPKGQNSPIRNAMAQKQESIRESQSRKDESIRMASTMRDAVLIATTMAAYEKYSKQEMKDNIMEWRAWLNDTYDA